MHVPCTLHTYVRTTLIPFMWMTASLKLSHNLKHIAFKVSLPLHKHTHCNLRTHRNIMQTMQ